MVYSEASSHEERGEPLEELAWPPRILEGLPLSLLMMGKTYVPAHDPEPGVVISPATTASETLTLEPILTEEDVA